MSHQEKLKKWQLLTSLLKSNDLLPLDPLPKLQAPPFLLRPEPAEVLAFNQLTGWADTRNLAPTWLQMRSFPSILNLLSSPDFPFLPLGLVHLKNNIVLHVELPVSAQYQVRCGITGYQSHSKGVVLKAYVEATLDQQTVYGVDARFLARIKTKSATPETNAQIRHPEIQHQQETLWHLETDTGRRYARISRDYNLIHINPLCAKLFGFRRHIAHGMYLQARALADIFESEAVADLAFPVQISTAFKKPAFLPADLILGYSPLEQGLSFDVYQGETLHVTGTIK